MFAELGPLRIFVSTHLLPPHYKFQPDSNPPEFVAQDQVAVNLVKGTKVRLRIVGSRMEATEIFAIGTMKEDYLGEFVNPLLSAVMILFATSELGSLSMFLSAKTDSRSCHPHILSSRPSRSIRLVLVYTPAVFNHVAISSSILSFVVVIFRSISLPITAQYLT